MRKGFEYHFTISQSTKTNNFAVPCRHISSISQTTTQASSYVDSEPAISNDKVLSANTFSKSEEENQIDKFIASKLLAFDFSSCINDNTLSLIETQPVNKNTKNNSTLSLINEFNFISLESSLRGSEVYAESKLSREFDSESDS